MVCFVKIKINRLFAFDKLGMQKLSFNIIFLGIISLILFRCANRGTASGGEKDITPPVIVKEVPENFSTNFDATEIKIFFNEYIKLKNIQKQLIVSPPMDPEPEITPLGTASKYITIKIYDTLQPNTTYAFNFGESIEDNNEGNAFPFYRYVFSTGSNIDSLSVKGVVTDAFEWENPERISVMLHEVDSTYNDSIIFKQKPKYIGVTDSLSQFSIENIKQGQYLLTALKEENTNYTYQSNRDKIAYRSKFISVPSDTAYVLKLFKQQPDFKFVRARQMAKSRVGFGYEGDPTQMQIKLLSKTNDSFAFTFSKEPKSDTLNFWFKPKKINLDSLQFEVSSLIQNDTVAVRIKNMDSDSLNIKTLSSILKLGESLEFEANIPLSTVDPTRVRVMDQDSIWLENILSLDSINRTKAHLKFNLNENNKYQITALPGAFTDFYNTQNDTLNVRVSTKLLSSYGDVRINVRNAKYPIIVQLVTKNGDVKTEHVAKSSGPIDFVHLDAGKYFLRVIFDSNNNGKYDAGHFLKKTQPERVSYAEDLIEVRADWSQIEDFTLED